MGWSGRAPAPPAGEAGKGGLRRGARHVTQAQFWNRRDPHAEAIAAIDLGVGPTLTFEPLFAFLVVGHGRRHLLWFAMTPHPPPHSLAQHSAAALPRHTSPPY